MDRVFQFVERACHVCRDCWLGKGLSYGIVVSRNYQQLHVLRHLLKKRPRHDVLAPQSPLGELELLPRVDSYSVHDVSCDDDISYPLDDVEVPQLAVEPRQEAAEVVGEEQLAADVQVGQHNRIRSSRRPNSLLRRDVGEQQIPRIELPRLSEGNVSDDEAVERQSQRRVCDLVPTIQPRASGGVVYDQLDAPTLPAVS